MSFFKKIVFIFTLFSCSTQSNHAMIKHVSNTCLGSGTIQNIFSSLFGRDIEKDENSRDRKRIYRSLSYYEKKLQEREKVNENEEGYNFTQKPMIDEGEDGYNFTQKPMIDEGEDGYNFTSKPMTDDDDDEEETEGEDEDGYDFTPKPMTDEENDTALKEFFQETETNEDVKYHIFGYLLVLENIRALFFEKEGYFFHMLNNALHIEKQPFAVVIRRLMAPLNKKGQLYCVYNKYFWSKMVKLAQRAIISGNKKMLETYLPEIFTENPPYHTLFPPNMTPKRAKKNLEKTKLIDLAFCFNENKKIAQKIILKFFPNKIFNHSMYQKFASKYTYQKKKTNLENTIILYHYFRRNRKRTSLGEIKTLQKLKNPDYSPENLLKKIMKNRLHISELKSDLRTFLPESFFKRLYLLLKYHLCNRTGRGLSSPHSMTIMTIQILISIIKFLFIPITDRSLTLYSETEKRLLLSLLAVLILVAIAIIDEVPFFHTPDSSVITCIFLFLPTLISYLISENPKEALILLPITIMFKIMFSIDSNSKSLQMLYREDTFPEALENLKTKTKNKIKQLVENFLKFLEKHTYLLQIVN